VFEAVHFKIKDSNSSRGTNTVPLFMSRCFVVYLPNLASLTACQEGTHSVSTMVLCPDRPLWKTDGIFG